MKKVFITGICGFVGGHLTRLMLDAGYEVSGLYHLVSDLDAFDPELKEKVTLYQCDITDPDAVEDVLGTDQSDMVFHLAGVAHVPFAEKNPALAFAVNTLGTRTILETIKHHANKKFIYISSCEVYGRHPADHELYTESHPVLPSNVYGITKSSAELICSGYAKKYGVPVIIFRPFNHIGAGQHEAFVASDFARQIVLIEQGKREPVMQVGNLEVMRDFSDVRDVVRGYLLAAEKIEGFEIFNICSGTPIRIRSLLDTLLSLSDKDISVKVDPAKFRKNDNEYLGGSHRKLTELTSWKPEISLQQTLEEILNYWRRRIR